MGLRMMAFIIRASVALLFLVATAGAYPVQAQNYDGDGVVRVGLFAQGTWLDINQTLPVAGNTEFSGFAGGISAGYDFWRTSRFVLGAEIDAAVGDMGDSIVPISYGFDYMATARGRAGVYVHPNWLVYGTVGAAWLGYEAQSSLTGDKASDTLTGLAVGGGTEVDWGNLIFFGEYLYTDFGSRNFVVDGTTQRVDIDGHVARFGIKYKIGHDFYYQDDVRPLK
jgi:outer membrane immunogenic protein